MKSEGRKNRDKRTSGLRKGKQKGNPFSHTASRKEISILKGFIAFLESQALCHRTTVEPTGLHGADGTSVRAEGTPLSL